MESKTTSQLLLHPSYTGNSIIIFARVVPAHVLKIITAERILIAVDIKNLIKSKIIPSCGTHQSCHACNSKCTHEFCFLFTQEL
jgi:hypothetical protein